MDDKGLEEEFNQLFAEEYNGKTVTSSLKVAAAFNKKHNNVLRDIDSLLKKIAKTSDAPDTFFIKRTYNNGNNDRSYPMYLMTLDGFSLLVSGYTGDDVFEKKLKYANMLIEKKVEKEKEKKPMGNLVIEMNNGHPVLDSREVAELVGMRHDHLIRNIDHYIEVMSQTPKLGTDDFFIKQTYTAGTGKQYKRYDITKKGCEMVANKMTGEKGILFTATYVERFHQMEEALNSRHNNNVMDIATVKKLVDKLDDNLSLISKGFETMRDSFNTVVEKQSKIIDILEGAFAEVDKNVNEEDIAPREDEYRLSDVARDFGWFSTSGLPHVDFLKCILRNQLSFNVSTAYEHEDDNTRCVMFLDGTGRNICHLYLKDNGLVLFNKWYEENKGGRTLRHAVTYQHNYRGHKPGDIRDIYYIVPGDKRQRHFRLDTRALLNS